MYLNPKYGPTPEHLGGDQQLQVKQAAKMDGLTWADHRKTWFEHLVMSGRPPDAIREVSFAASL